MACPWCQQASAHDGHICRACLARELAVLPTPPESLRLPNDPDRLLCRGCYFPTAMTVLCEGYCERCAHQLRCALAVPIPSVSLSASALVPTTTGVGRCPTPGCGRRLKPRCRHCSADCAQKNGYRPRGPVKKVSPTKTCLRSGCDQVARGEALYCGRACAAQAKWGARRQAPTHA